MDTNRRYLIRGGLASGLALAGAGAALSQARTDTEPRTLNGNPMPEPSAEVSAGPVRANRGSTLKGKLAVVTGGARGIGRAIAVEFAANGADVVVLDIAGPVSPAASDARPATPEDLAETVRQIKQYGRVGESVQVDIRNISALRKAADTIHGRIIVLSSMQGKHGTKDASSYSASKWGILGLMKSAALELGQYGITVNALIPGLVDTALTRYEKRLTESMAESGHKPSGTPTPQEAWDARAPTVPLHVGWLQPDDISPAAVFLASDAAAMVTGAEYEVTGGDSAKDI